MWETKSQIHKENNDVTPENSYVSDDDHVHEDIKVNTIVAHAGVVKKNNKKIKYASKRKKDHIIEYVKNDVETLCEDVVSNDESIFMECSVNSRVYTMFNKHTKSTMGFIKVFVNDFKIEVEDDVKDILHDIVVPALKKNKKIVGGKKIPINIHIAPLDDVYFHYEESMLNDNEKSYRVF